MLSLNNLINIICNRLDRCQRPSRIFVSTGCTNPVIGHPLGLHLPTDAPNRRNPAHPCGRHGRPHRRDRSTPNALRTNPPPTAGGAGLFHLLFDGFGDRLHLRLRISMTDHKIISDHRQTPNIKNSDALGFLLLGGRGRQLSPPGSKRLLLRSWLADSVHHVIAGSYGQGIHFLTSLDEKNQGIVQRLQYGLIQILPSQLTDFLYSRKLSPGSI